MPWNGSISGPICAPRRAHRLRERASPSRARRRRRCGRVAKAAIDRRSRSLRLPKQRRSPGGTSAFPARAGARTDERNGDDGIARGGEPVTARSRLRGPASRACEIGEEEGPATPLRRAVLSPQLPIRGASRRRLIPSVHGCLLVSENRVQSVRLTSGSALQRASSWPLPLAPARFVLAATLSWSTVSSHALHEATWTTRSTRCSWPGPQHDHHNSTKAGSPPGRFPATAAPAARDGSTEFPPRLTSFLPVRSFIIVRCQRSRCCSAPPHRPRASKTILQVRYQSAVQVPRPAAPGWPRSFTRLR